MELLLYGIATKPRNKALTLSCGDFFFSKKLTLYCYDRILYRDSISINPALWPKPLLTTITGEEDPTSINAVVSICKVARSPGIKFKWVRQIHVLFS